MVRSIASSRASRRRKSRNPFRRKSAPKKVQIVGIPTEQTRSRHINPHLLLALQNESDAGKKLRMLRNMPGLSIHIRRTLRAKMQLSNVKLVSKIKDWKHRRGRNIVNFCLMWQATLASMKPWSGSIKRIEGQYGAAVASYFIFLRWLFFLNIFLCVLVLVFLMTPQFIFPVTGFDRAVAGDTPNATVQLIASCSALYEQKDKNVSRNFMSHVSDILQGTGWMENSAFFYGNYPNSQLKIFASFYNIPLAYLVVTLIYLLISMFVMIRHTGKSLRARVVASDAKNFKSSNSIFCGWHFGVNDPQACECNSSAIFSQLLSDIYEARYKARRENRSIYQKITIYSTRFFINLLVILVLFCAFYLIYTATQESTKLLERQSSVFSTSSEVEHSDTNLGKNIRLFYEFLPSLVMTSLSFVIPRVFSRIVTGEDYSQEFATQITLIRTVFLKLASPAILLGTLYIQVTCSTVDACNVGKPPACRQIRCWETYVGQQIYKVMILDLLSIIFVIVLIDFPRKFIVTHLNFCITNMIGKAKFNTNKCVLNLVYGQTLVWLGVFFSPMIAVASVIKLFIVFYLRMLTCVVNFDPPVRTYQASKLYTFFITLLMAAFIVCSAPIIFAISTITPSRGCGPFRYYDLITDVFRVTIDNFPASLKFAFNFLASPGFAVPVVLIILMLVYYYRMRAASYKATCRNLQSQLMVEVNAVTSGIAAAP